MEKTPESFLEALKNLVTEKTRVISLSAVHWCTGMPLPLDQIGVLCKEKNIDFVIDGAQGVGMQPMDLKKANISYMAFSAWKWLMGPMGLGVLYVSKEKLDVLEPVFIGTESVVQAREYLPYKSKLKSTADRFTFSTVNFNDWVYFDAAIEFLQDIGFFAVRERIFELSAHLSKELTRIGFKVLSDQFSDYPTGIVVCEKPGVRADKIVEHLKKNNIIVAERLGRVRFSPHVYISPEQLDEVIQALARIS